MKGVLSGFLMFFVLISCSDNSSGPGEESSGNQFPSNIQGVWQEDASTAEGDEIGIYFTSNAMGAWDYLGDSYDGGDDCYFAQDLFEIVSFDGNDFVLNIQGDEVPVTISVNGSSLSFDVVDEPVESYTKDSRSVGDLTPTCSTNKISSEKRNKIIELLKNGQL